MSRWKSEKLLHLFFLILKSFVFAHSSMILKNMYKTVNLQNIFVFLSPDGTSILLGADLQARGLLFSYSLISVIITVTVN